MVVPPLADGPSDEPLVEPLDLGTVTVKVFDTLDPGEVAPVFALGDLSGDLSGGTVRLSDYHGKLVVLNFWATSSRPSLAELPNLAAVHKKFADDPRLVMIGLTCDQQIEPARDYVQKNSLPWIQAHAGARGAGMGAIAKKYSVRELPATFLIGPDGRVLSKNLRSADLDAAISTALADETLFAAADATPLPVRFPVTRFTVDDTPPLPADKLAALVMDDSDPDYEKGRPHDDALRAYAADGSELWSVGGLNTCQTVSTAPAVGLAVDLERGRIFVGEKVGNRITALDFSGRKLWQLDEIDVGALAIDQKTGNLWVIVGSSIGSGEAVVFDPEGDELAAHLWAGVDIVNDSARDVFWLAGAEILQVDRTGKVRARLPVSGEGGWCCASIALDPTDGSAWFGEREHPDVSASHNRLWHVDSQGKVLAKIELDKFSPMMIARNPATGDLWLAGHPSEIRRFSADGTALPTLPIEAVGIAFDRAGSSAWVTTKTDLMKINFKGQSAWSHPRTKPSLQSWLTAF